MERYPPPDPNPRKPVFEVPKGACDCHLHVFGPKDRYPVIAAPKYEPHFDLDIARVCAMHAALGIERAVFVTATVYGTDNRITLDTVRQGGGRYRGIAIVADDVSAAELDEMHEAGIRGIRFNFARFLGEGPEPDRLLRGADLVGPRGWHLVLHVQGDELLELEPALRDLAVPTVIDHLAHLDLDEPRDRDALSLLKELLARGNFWIKVSNADRMSKAGPPYHDIVPLGRALVEAAPDRCVWGTDWPHVFYRKPVMANDGDTFNLLAEYAPDAAVRRKILVDNPAALYGF